MKAKFVLQQYIYICISKRYDNVILIRQFIYLSVPLFYYDHSSIMDGMITRNDNTSFNRDFVTNREIFLILNHLFLHIIINNNYYLSN